MDVEFVFPETDSLHRVYLTWTPVEATAKVVNVPAGTGSVNVLLQNGGLATGGRVSLDSLRSSSGASSLALTLPANGDPVSFWIAGEFGQPSVALDDAAVQAIDAASGVTLGSKNLTVRIRKNAITLTAAERDRFLSAFGTLNGADAGRFTQFRDMHTSRTSGEAHGDAGFLPWHRTYLLDLERELQAIDPSVSLPYWRFDRPAPSLFTRAYMGTTGPGGRVAFSAGHPLNSWTTDNRQGILRTLGFNPGNAPPGPISEAATLRLGGAAPNGNYAGFRSMEGSPHGPAHTSFSGFISRIPTAARDPLFFMLHANVDRLWAKWQWMNDTHDQANPRSFQTRTRLGHRLGDQMWPWNGDTSSPRPPTAPGGGLQASPVTVAPGTQPHVRDMLDYQAIGGGPSLEFGYDDVPFDI